MRDEVKNVLKRSDGNYTVVPNLIIYDSSISAKAKGVFAYLLSRPVEWSFYMSEIPKHFKDGTKAIRSAIEELEECGYLARTRFGASDGGTYYEWHLTPEAKTAFNPKGQKGRLVSKEYIYTINNTIKDSNNNTNSKPKKSTRFKKPSLQEVQAYCTERGNNVDAGQFIDFYESKGWKVGKSSMKSWEASVRTWERSSGGANQQPKLERPMGRR